MRDDLYNDERFRRAGRNLNIAFVYMVVALLLAIVGLWFVLHGNSKAAVLSIIASWVSRFMARHYMREAEIILQPIRDGIIQLVMETKQKIKSEDKEDK